MRAVREIIDGELLCTVMPLPGSFRNAKLEVLVVPVQEKQKTPQAKKSFLGALAKYANPSLVDQEENAWASAAAEKHEDR